MWLGFYCLLGRVLSEALRQPRIIGIVHIRNEIGSRDMTSYLSTHELELDLGASRPQQPSRMLENAFEIFTRHRVEVPDRQSIDTRYG